MQAILFYLSLPFLFLVSVLPFFMLYGLSDLVFVLLYYVFGYRRKVVTQNLQRAFPQKTAAEIASLRRTFYRYFCDLLLETFKTLTISRNEMLRRCNLDPSAKQLFDTLENQGKSSIIVMGHLGNWEWGGNAFSLACRQPLYVIYHPLTNPYYNRFIMNMRKRFGSRLIAMKDTFREMVANKSHISATAFIADQTPPPEGAYWTTFLNQETPVFWGTERIARKLNFPVVYVSILRQRRGYYTLFAEMLCDKPSGTSEGEISQMHTRRLEKDIVMKPETWLWTHRRWKHFRQSAD